MRGWGKKKGNRVGCSENLFLHFLLGFYLIFIYLFKFLFILILLLHRERVPLSTFTPLQKKMWHKCLSKIKVSFLLSFSFSLSLSLSLFLFLFFSFSFSFFSFLFSFSFSFSFSFFSFFLFLSKISFLTLLPFHRLMIHIRRV